MSDPWTVGRPAECVRAAVRPRVLNATYNNPVRCYLLDSVVWSRWMHYDGTHNRVVPCCRTPDCAYCPDPTARVNGYIAAFSHELNKPGILYVSDLALADLARITSEYTDSRGLQVETYRKDKRSASPMHCRYLGCTNPKNLPPSFDPRALLERMWGFNPAHITPSSAADAGDRSARRADRKADA